jgi:hypothetical protein
VRVKEAPSVFTFVITNHVSVVCGSVAQRAPPPIASTHAVTSHHIKQRNAFSREPDQFDNYNAAVVIRKAWLCALPYRRNLGAVVDTAVSRDYCFRYALIDGIAATTPVGTVGHGNARGTIHRQSCKDRQIGGAAPRECVGRFCGVEHIGRTAANRYIERLHKSAV